MEPLSRTAFREWLSQRPGAAFTGNSCEECPLATYLQMEVFHDRAYGYDAAENLMEVPLPPWAMLFIKAVDGRAADHIMLPITGLEALSLLDSLEGK